MSNLTVNEIEFLKGIDASEYGDYLVDDIWFFSVKDNCELSKAQMGGVTASLIEKGLIVVQGENTRHKIGNECGEYEHIVRMTAEGIAAYVATVGAENVNKLVEVSA